MGAYSEVSDLFNIIERDSKLDYNEKEMNTKSNDNKIETTDFIDHPYNLNEIDDEKKEFVELNEQDPSTEFRSTGSVSLKLYYKYFTSGFGFFGFLIAISLFLTTRATTIISDYWLANWSSFESLKTNQSQKSFFIRSEYKSESMFEIYSGKI